MNDKLETLFVVEEWGGDTKNVVCVAGGWGRDLVRLFWRVSLIFFLFGLVEEGRISILT